MKRKEPPADLDGDHERGSHSKRQKIDDTPKKDDPVIVGGVLKNPQTFHVGIEPAGEIKIRDAKAREQEAQGRLSTRIVVNDNTQENLAYLLNLKRIFSNQLPKMPREYITRLVFDKKHKAVCVIRKDGPNQEKVVGGIHYLPFPTQGFIEIVFCAVSGDEQYQGYGTYIMNQLKVQAKKEGLFHFLTYADNFAIEYFKKQGFTTDMSEYDRKQWAGYIKDYDGGTMMYCRVDRELDYIQAPFWIRDQRKKVVDKLLELSTSHIKYKGFSEFKNVQRIAMDRLQALLDVGWNPKPYQDLMSSETQQKIQKINEDFLGQFKNDKDAWPFQTAVSREEVKDYYEVIKDPIDLGTMDARLKKGGYYITQEMLVADLKRMMENCKTYNPSGNMFHDIATRLEKKYLEKWKPVPIV